MLGGRGAGRRGWYRRLPLHPAGTARGGAPGRSPRRALLGVVVLGAGGLLVWAYVLGGVLRLREGAAGGAGGGVWGHPEGVVTGQVVSAASLERLDRNHIYRFRADDHSYFKALKKNQEQHVRKGALEVEGFQSYVDSIPELKAMQRDCLTRPDEDFYNRFSRNVPNMTPRGDLSGVKGLKPGMEVNDGIVRMRGEYKINLAAGLYGGVDKATAQATDKWMKNSGNFYYPPSGFREWHTNQCQYNNQKRYEYGTQEPAFDSTADCRGLNFTHGWRGYLINAPEDGRSWMSVVDKNGHFRTLMDKSGYVSLFYLPGEGKNCWHTIASETHRWSIGFRIEDEYFEHELLPALQANGADIEDVPLSLSEKGASA